MIEAKLKTIPLRLLYDTWASEGQRIPAGTVLDLPLKAAKLLISEGKAERNDPLPGDEE